MSHRRPRLDVSEEEEEREGDECDEEKDRFCPLAPSAGCHHNKRTA